MRWSQCVRPPLLICQCPSEYGKFVTRLLRRPRRCKLTTIQRLHLKSQMGPPQGRQTDDQEEQVVVMERVMERVMGWVD